MIPTFVIFQILFPCPRIQFRISHLSSHHFSLVSSGLWQFLSFLVSHVVTRLYKSWPDMCKMSLNVGLSDVFLIARLVLWILGKKTVDMKCPSHPNISGSTWHKRDVLMMLTNIDLLVKVVLICFSSIKLLFFHFVSSIHWKQVTKSSPHSRLGQNMG